MTKKPFRPVIRLPGRDDLPPPPAPEIITLEQGLVVRRTVDQELSQIAAATAHALSNECFRNAVMGMHISGRVDRLRYVEGWVFDPKSLVHDHAWIEDVDGTVIEPTLFGTPNMAHFPVFRWTFEQVQAAIDAAAQMTLYLRFGRGSRERRLFMEHEAVVWRWVMEQRA